jgi:gamma-glutamyl-gamma-aminobutyrate hydrolase PuuD
MDGLGDGLRAVAWAPDGVVEAIEAPGSPFVLGVQWHAEGLAEVGVHAKLFPSFIGASRAYSALRGRRTA